MEFGSCLQNDIPQLHRVHLGFLLQVVAQSPDDKVLVIGAGVTLTEAMKAADQLQQSGIHICIIDPFTIKPLDNRTIVEHARRVGGKVITVEDHYPQGMPT